MTNKSDQAIRAIEYEIINTLLQYGLSVAEHQRILLECFLQASYHAGISATQLEQIFEYSLREYESVRHPQRKNS